MNSYIAFDYLAVQPTSFSPFHGGGKYGKIVLKELLSKTENIILFYSSRFTHNELDEIQKTCKNVVMADLENPCVLDEIFSSYEISCLYLPIPFSRLFKRYSSKFPQNMRIVGTIHGLRNLEAIPTIEVFRYKTSLKGCLRTMLEFVKSHVPGYRRRVQQMWKKLIETPNYEYFVVSNHTKKAIQSFLPNQDPLVFYSPSVVSDYVSPLCDKEKYFLMVSGNRWEKNNLRALRVLDDMFSRGNIPNDFRIKITGIRTITSFRYNFVNYEKFECLDYVPEGEFSKLYAKAYALIYPSLSEGFGYPILEAFAHNTPVVASNITSIPEIGGDAVFYFNPLDDGEIENAIIKILNIDNYLRIQSKINNQLKMVFSRQVSDLSKAVEFIMRK